MPKLNKICLFCKKHFLSYPSEKQTYCSRICVDLAKKADPNFRGFWFGKTRSVSTKQKISKTKQGTEPWNKGQTCPKTSGNNHHLWKGGRIKTRKGYVEVYMPSHPNHKKNNKVLEHRIVMEKSLGRFLLRSEVVHHINGHKDDNRIENLVLCQSDPIHRKTYHGIK